jgi:hypothetical protein
MPPRRGFSRQTGFASIRSATTIQRKLRKECFVMKSEQAGAFGRREWLKRAALGGAALSFWDDPTL